MICEPCTNRRHSDCRIGCCCQHRDGTYAMTGADRHRLAIDGVIPDSAHHQHTTPEETR